MKWFVAYVKEVHTPDGRIGYWPNSRIISKHPLVWFADVLRTGGGPLVLTWWTPLTDEEAALNTQVITE